MARTRSRARGRARGRGGRGIYEVEVDDHASAASAPVRGRGRRGRGRGIVAEGSASSVHEEVAGNPPPFQALAEAMRDVARAIRDEIPPPPPRSPRRETSPDPVEAKFRRFMRDFERRNPPTFSGGSDIMVAEDWLQRINRIFTFIGLKDDAIRINAATFQFTGEAIHWWDITLVSNPIDRMTWADFERLFLGQYFPEAVRNEKRSELFSLKQGDLSVTEYEMKFSSLARFAAAQLTDDVFKATIFEARL